MKKFLLTVLCLMLLFSCFAEASESQTVIYTYVVQSDGTAQITDFDGEVAELSIPDALDGYTVTSIGDGAFDSCENLTSVVIPASVTSIGQGAFSLCKNLTSVFFVDSTLSTDNSTQYSFNPDAALSIGEQAFSNCSKLVVVYLPKTIARIASESFAYCPKLTMVAIPGDIIDISPNAFYKSNNPALRVDRSSFAEAFALKYNFHYLYTPD